MAWIAKRVCRVRRGDETINIQPGQPVPEAKNWKKPTQWCVWALEPEKKEVIKPIKEKDAVVLNQLPVKKLRELAKVKDPSADLEKATKPELLAILEETKTETTDDKKDYSKTPIKTLRKLVREIQTVSGDTSTDIQLANREELITIIKSQEG